MALNNEPTSSRWEGVLPPDLEEAFRRAHTDQTGDRIDNEIALIDSLIVSKLKEITIGSDQKNWNQAKLALRKCKRLVMGMGNDVKVGNSDIVFKAGIRAENALTEAIELIDNGAGEVDLIKEIRSLIEDKRKLVESQAKADNLRKRYIDRSEMLAIIYEVVLIVSEEVSDEATLIRVRDRLKRGGIIDTIRRPLPESQEAPTEPHRLLPIDSPLST